MAKFIGSELTTGNYGEDFFCKLLIDSFPDNYILYRNRQVFGREFDMAMLIPDVGIVVFEIKGWRESTVLRIENGDSVVIKTDDSEAHATPQKQARGYRFAVERRLLQDLGAKPIVFSMVVYPQISQDCYVQKSLNIITEPQFTVLKEDTASSSAIQAKLAMAVNEVQMWHRTALTASLCIILVAYLKVISRDIPTTPTSYPESRNILKRRILCLSSVLRTRSSLMQNSAR